MKILNFSSSKSLPQLEMSTYQSLCTVKKFFKPFQSRCSVKTLKCLPNLQSHDNFLSNSLFYICIQAHGTVLIMWPLKVTRIGLSSKQRPCARCDVMRALLWLAIKQSPHLLQLMVLRGSRSATPGQIKTPGQVDTLGKKPLIAKILRVWKFTQ